MHILKTIPLSAVALLAMSAYAHAQKDPVSMGPPRADLANLADMPAIAEHEVRFELHAKLLEWPADTPLQLVGPASEALLLERLFDRANPVSEPDRLLEVQFGDRGAAEIELPIRREAASPLLRFWGFRNAEPSIHKDKLFVVTGALTPDMAVFFYRAIRGQYHLTTASSRLEVVDFRTGRAMAFVGNWTSAERLIGGPYLGQKLESDNVRIVLSTLDDAGRQVSTEAAYVWRYSLHHYLDEPSKPEHNRLRREALNVFVTDNDGRIRSFPSWRDARRTLSDESDSTLKGYESFFSGRYRTPPVFAKGIAPTVTDEPWSAYKDGAAVDRNKLELEGGLLLLPFMRCSSNHSPSLGVTDPRTDFSALKAALAKWGEKPVQAMPRLPWLTQTSSAELGDVVVQLKAKCKPKLTQLRTSAGWVDALEIEGIDRASADQLGLEGGTLSGTVADGLLLRLWMASAESVPGKYASVDVAPATKKKGR